MASDIERHLHARIERLENELHTVREQLRRFYGPEAQQARRRTALADRYGLSAMQAEMLWHMMAHPGSLTRTRLYDLLYAGRIDGGPDMRTLDVHLCYLRKALAKHGVTVACPRNGTFVVTGALEDLETVDPLDTSLLRYQILQALSQRDATTQHMARKMHLSCRHLSVFLNGLFKEGFVERPHAPRRREGTWSITQSGRAELDKETQARSKSNESEHQKAA